MPENALGDVGTRAGPDLGNASATSRSLLPAWQRYTGNLYKKADFRGADVQRQDVRIIVVSALFGLLDVRDPIRKYNVAMRDQLPRQSVKRFWRKHGLVGVFAGHEGGTFFWIVYTETLEMVYGSGEAWKLFARR